jgi:hypothetical protein
VAAAVSGGGLRAANFAVGVMSALETYRTADGRRVNLLRELDYFSSVSGGGLAAGAYIAELKRWRATHDAHEPFSLTAAMTRTRLRRRLRRNLEVSLFAGLVEPRIPFTSYDHGDALEKMIDNIYFGHDAKYNRAWYPLRLGDMYVPADDATRACELPVLAANTTIITSCERFPVTPNMLAWLKVTTYTHRFHTVTYHAPAFYYDMPMAVPVKASASFPVAIPTSNMRCYGHGKRRYLHLQDGGVVENIGYKTALNMLKRDDPTTTRRVLVVIDAYNSTAKVHRMTRHKSSPSFAGVLAALQTAGLESRHRVLQHELTTQGALHRAGVVYLGFDRLLPVNRDDLTLAPQVENLVRKGVLEPGSPAAVLGELRRQVYDISTRLKITETQQSLLYAAAEQIVHNQRPLIDRLLVAAVQAE